MSFGGLGNPSDSFAVMANSFIQAIARSPLSMGLGMGRTGDDLNLAGLMGISDPGAAIALNQILQPLLMQVTGQKYTSAQYSGGTNMYTQMNVGNALRDQGRAARIASSEDQQGIYNMMEGTSRLMGQKFGKNERRAAQQFAKTMSEALPTLSQYAPDLVEGFFGERGSATIMSQNMFKGGRYAVDPVTGRRGYSAESAGEITKGVYNRLYGANADISEMSGLTAGKAGAMFDEMQRRGLMPNSSASRGKNLQGIAEQLGTTVADVSKLPDLDSKLREFDASKISERLKGMSKAVSAMQEVFGEMGEPNAPMTQLVGAIETLTQSSMQGMTPIQMEKMIRNTANTARVAGIEMPEMFRQMGITAGMADAAGVNRALVPGITNQAILENQASKNRFGGAKAFGMLSSDSLLNLQEQLGVQASKDDSTHDMASIIRAVEVYGHVPKEGSEFEAVYKALKDKSSGGEYEYNGIKKNVYSLTRQHGGVQGFLAKDGNVSAAEINALQYNREANSRIIAENELGTNIGRANQNLRMVEDLARYSSTTVRQISSDKDLMGEANFGTSTAGDQNSLEISRVASEALVNVEPGDIGAEKAPKVVAAALTRHFKNKGVNIGEAEQKVIDRMSAGIAEGSEKFATSRRMVGGTVTMQQLASKELFREAQATKAEVEIDTAFQQKFRSEGKQGLMSRVSDFVRSANRNTDFNDFIATALNYQPASLMADKLQEDFDKLKESRDKFNSMDPGAIRADYFQTAVANSDPKDDKQKQAIMDEMVASKFATNDNKEEVYKGFVEQGVLNGKGKNKQLLDSFEERTGMSMAEMKGSSDQSIRTISKTKILKRMEEQAEKLHVSFKIAGVTFKGGARESELNRAIDELGNDDMGAAGIDRAETYLDNYALNSETYSKGGQEGETIRQRALDKITHINRLAAATGQSKTDLLEMNPADFSVLGLEGLKAVNGQEVNALKSMQGNNYAATQVSNQTALTKAKTTLEDLEKDPVKNKNAIATQRAEVKMRQGLVETKKDEVDDKLKEAEKTQRNLKDPGKKTEIEAALKDLSKATEQETKHKSEIDAFAKKIKETRPDFKGIKDDRDLSDLIDPTETQLQAVAGLRAKLEDATSPEEKKVIKQQIADQIKESKANPDKFIAVNNIAAVDTVLAKIKGLDGKEQQFLKDNSIAFNAAYNQSKKEFSDADELNLERLNSKELKDGKLSAPDTDAKNRLEEKQKQAKATYAASPGDPTSRADYMALRDRQNKKKSLADEKTLKIAAAQLNMDVAEIEKLEPGQLKNIEAARKQKAANSSEFNAEVDRLRKQGMTIEEAKVKAQNTLIEQDPKMVAAVGKVEGLKNLSDSLKSGIARDLSDLDQTLQKGDNTKLSPIMAKAVAATAKLKQDSTVGGATANFAEFFKTNLNTNFTPEETGKLTAALRTDRRTANDLAGALSMGGAAAAKLAGLDKGKDNKEIEVSPKLQMGAIRELLNKQEGNLTDPEKKLIAGLKSKIPGLTKDSITAEGTVDAKSFLKSLDEIQKKKKTEEENSTAKSRETVLAPASIKLLADAYPKKQVLTGTLNLIGGDLDATADGRC